MFVVGTLVYPCAAHVGGVSETSHYFSRLGAGGFPEWPWQQHHMQHSTGRLLEAQQGCQNEPQPPSPPATPLL